MGWSEVKPLIYNPNPPSYDYGCVMLYFTFYDLPIIHSQITPSHVYILQNDKSMFGLERTPHTTLLYGLHSNVNVEDVDKKLSDLKYSECLVDNISLFENKYDVLKYDVSGSSLHEANAILTQFPHTTDYPIYHPHLTIAYLKSGFGSRYVTRFKKTKYKLKPTHLVYTKPNGKEYQIDINNK